MPDRCKKYFGHAIWNLKICKFRRLAANKNDDESHFERIDVDKDGYWQREAPPFWNQ